jgi:hypothetical protein
MGSKVTRLLAVATILSLAVSACDGVSLPTAPTVQPSAPRLTLVAPGEIALGESAQLTANLHHADGSVQDVTGQAEWVAGRPLAVSTTGLATGQEPGRAPISVGYAGQKAVSYILVLSRGTFALSGQVTICGRGFPGATVTVLSGVGQGLTTRSDPQGYFELFGVAGPIVVRASGAGSPDTTLETDMTTHASLTFALFNGSPSGEGCWDY